MRTIYKFTHETARRLMGFSGHIEAVGVDVVITIPFGSSGNAQEAAKKIQERAEKR